MADNEVRLTIADFADEDLVYIAMNRPGALYGANGIKAFDIGVDLLIAAVDRLPWKPSTLMKVIEARLEYAHHEWTPAERAFIEGYELGRGG